MDSNTFQLGLAIVAAVQVIALAWITAQQRRTQNQASAISDKVDATHTLVQNLQPQGKPDGSA